MYNQKYKKLSQTIKDGPVTGKTSFPRVVFSPSFLAEFPSGVWRLAMSTYLPQLLRSTREGAQGGAPPAIQEDAGRMPVA